ncbi:hypothetical protein Pmani_023824 [Petrolisthes manimaculis]|uniref:Uncharacterized protein n=1 Tax=Petrolisthes manimaculis TaxID=1843537 RepID=A0AAE1U2W0_9EUCA|nr:hypothetical protein Pmani_023824 [Petrolisthes manimaculis]
MRTRGGRDEDERGTRGGREGEREGGREGDERGTRVLFACMMALALAAPQLEVEVDVPLSLEPETLVELPVDAAGVAAAADVASGVAAGVGAGVAAAPLIVGKSAVELLRDERVDSGNGNFNFAIEADNGVAMAVEGSPGVEGGVSMSGSYRFVLGDGSVAEVTFIADENGFQPQSDLLPTPHPLPAHVYELLRIAEEQRAQGITFE